MNELKAVSCKFKYQLILDVLRLKVPKVMYTYKNTQLEVAQKSACGGGQMIEILGIDSVSLC